MNKEKQEAKEQNGADSQSQPEQAVHVHGPHCNHGHHETLKPLVRSIPKIGRNDPCLCGSQKKYKKCCGQ